ncbi:MAG: hypothetical protein KIT73_09185 [Burkholderiales bacterium]|nr:hypothetical protein [Burkholderiales bacterium]
MPRDERPVAAVPPWIVAATAALLAAQLLFRVMQPLPAASAVDLSPAPPVPALRVMALGEPIALGQSLALYLQAFDNQPGVSIPFAALDYGRVTGWLGAILDLDPHGQYPLMMAAHLYAQVLQRPDKQREMSEFVFRRFFDDPDHRWPWLAHVAIMAKHRLKDLPTALRYADAIRSHAGPDVPSWARQMHIFLLEDMGEVEAARILLGGLLASGTISDPREIHFLTQRLMDLENAEKSTAPSR